MSAPRRRHFAVEDLSEEGQAAVQRGLEDGLTLEATQQALRQATGETIGISSLHRWQRWQATQRRWTERAAALDTAVELLKAVPDPRFLGALNNALKDHLTDKMEELRDNDAPELIAHMLRLEKLELEHKRVAIAEQMAQAKRIRAVAAEKQAEAALTAADAAMKRVELLERKARDAMHKLGDAARTATGGRVPVAVIQTVMEDLYGITAEGGADA